MADNNPSAPPPATNPNAAEDQQQQPIAGDPGTGTGDVAVDAIAANADHKKYIPLRNDYVKKRSPNRYTYVYTYISLFCYRPDCDFNQIIIG